MVEAGHAILNSYNSAVNHIVEQNYLNTSHQMATNMNNHPEMTSDQEATSNNG